MFCIILWHLSVHYHFWSVTCHPICMTVSELLKFKKSITHSQNYYYFSEDDHFLIVPSFFSRQLLQSFAMTRTIYLPIRAKILSFRPLLVLWYGGQAPQGLQVMFVESGTLGQG